MATCGPCHEATVATGQALTIPAGANIRGNGALSNRHGGAQRIDGRLMTTDTVALHAWAGSRSREERTWERTSDPGMPGQNRTRESAARTGGGKSVQEDDADKTGKTRTREGSVGAMGQIRLRPSIGSGTDTIVVGLLRRRRRKATTSPQAEEQPEKHGAAGAGDHSRAKKEPSSEAGDGPPRSCRRAARPHAPTLGHNMVTHPAFSALVHNVTASGWAELPDTHALASSVGASIVAMLETGEAQAPPGDAPVRDGGLIFAPPDEDGIGGIAIFSAAHLRVHTVPVPDDVAGPHVLMGEVAARARNVDSSCGVIAMYLRPESSTSRVEEALYTATVRWTTAIAQEYAERGTPLIILADINARLGRQVGDHTAETRLTPRARRIARAMCDVRMYSEHRTPGQEIMPTSLPISSQRGVDQPATDGAAPRGAVVDIAAGNVEVSTLGVHVIEWAEARRRVHEYSVSSTHYPVVLRHIGGQTRPRHRRGGKGAQATRYVADAQTKARVAAWRATTVNVRDFGNAARKDYQARVERRLAASTDPLGDTQRIARMPDGEAAQQVEDALRVIVSALADAAAQTQSEVRAAARAQPGAGPADSALRRRLTAVVGNQRESYRVLRRARATAKETEIGRAAGVAKDAMRAVRTIKRALARRRGRRRATRTRNSYASPETTRVAYAATQARSGDATGSKVRTVVAVPAAQLHAAAAALHRDPRGCQLNDPHFRHAVAALPPTDEVTASPVTCMEVLREVCEAPRRASPGPDGISIVAILRALPTMTNWAARRRTGPAPMSGTRLLQRLARVSTVCLQRGIFPTAYAAATMGVIGKHTGRVTDKKRVRFVTMTNVLVRSITSRILSMRLIVHVHRAGRLPKGIFGFVPQRSIDTAVQMLITVIRQRAAVGLHTVAMPNDIEKYFDNVDVAGLLLRRLVPMGLGPTVRYLAAMYAARTVALVADGEPIASISYEIGVFQGDPLSCILAVVDSAEILEDAAKGMAQNAALEHDRTEVHRMRPPRLERINGPRADRTKERHGGTVWGVAAEQWTSQARLQGYLGTRPGVRPESAMADETWAIRRHPGGGVAVPPWTEQWRVAAEPRAPGAGSTASVYVPGVLVSQRALTWEMACGVALGPMYADDITKLTSSARGADLVMRSMEHSLHPRGLGWSSSKAAVMLFLPALRTHYRRHAYGSPAAAAVHATDPTRPVPGESHLAALHFAAPTMAPAGWNVPGAMVDVAAKEPLPVAVQYAGPYCRRQLLSRTGERTPFVYQRVVYATG